MLMMNSLVYFMNLITSLAVVNMYFADKGVIFNVTRTCTCTHPNPLGQISKQSLASCVLLLSYFQFANRFCANTIYCEQFHETI